MPYLKLAAVASFIILCSLACTDASNTGQSNTANANVNTSRAATTNPTPAISTPTPDLFAEARSTYNATCVRCHKENGEGGEAELEEGQKLKVPSFKAEHAVKHSDKDLARTISNGDDGMPSFKKRLTPEQIDGLVRFIRHEFQQGLATGASPSPATSNSTGSQPAH